VLVRLPVLVSGCRHYTTSALSTFVDGAIELELPATFMQCSQQSSSIKILHCRGYPVKIFQHLGAWYLRVVPAKGLFQSTMVHEVVNRGDVFAVRLSDQRLTILPGSLKVDFVDAEVTVEEDTAQLEGSMNDLRTRS
jgi:hypothetical protein